MIKQITRITAMKQQSDSVVLRKEKPQLSKVSITNKDVILEVQQTPPVPLIRQKVFRTSIVSTNRKEVTPEERPKQIVPLIRQQVFQTSDSVPIIQQNMINI